MAKLDTGARAATVLVADDEANIRNGLAQALRDTYQVVTAPDGEAALHCIEGQKIDAAVVDLRMPRLDGAGLLRKISADWPGVPVIILTGHGTIGDAVRAIRNGAYDFLTKPVNLDHLSAVLRRALEHQRLSRHNDALRVQLADSERKLRTAADSGITAKSKAMQDIMRTIDRIAESDATVLVTGESGVGKELVAEAIHTASRRSGEPLIKVHCAALSDTLLESELFGHEKGAFTGAISQRKGRFELADGGSIFLDEIGEINATTQVKLLRVLQERAFERVGGERTITVDTRIIAATNRDLQQEMQGGNFREDLYYRLNVVHINIPPLRERREDLPELIQVSLEQISGGGRGGARGAPRRLTPQALAALQAYHWPGNIRELRNALESAAVMSPESLIGVEHLPRSIVHSEDKVPTGAGNGATKEESADGGVVIPGGATIVEAERLLILAALDAARGNKTRAAAALGIQRATLYNKMRDYGITE